MNGPDQEPVYPIRCKGATLVSPYSSRVAPSLGTFPLNTKPLPAVSAQFPKLRVTRSKSCENAGNFHKFGHRCVPVLTGLRANLVQFDQRLNYLVPFRV